MSQTALISRLNELPRLQKILQELLDMVNQDDVDFGELANKIGMEQILSARLLRMANSAHFGGNKTISSVNDALIRVGSGPVKTLVVASVLSSAFPKVPSLDMTEYWTNTFEVATLASRIAIASGVENGIDANEAFTAAILHNIGELMIHTLAPEDALSVAKLVEDGQDELSAQQQVLGTTAPELGALLAKTWKFPDHMVGAIKHYPDAPQTTEKPQLAVVLHFARDIHANWDEQEDDKAKATFIATHQDSRALIISSAVRESIDKVRGNGADMATQMMAA
ncbi:HDOD domain-containing protein [Vibrio tapetis subsp. quintayensis]|uniref:HDOD domain-containing protein n=1 Tax=Vibrio tapetis TaxID=52443 RepID=UPI0025B480D9|nr:HDOD domain-containing protein [Vibrio tapetis]MDN3681526.1 HDOD domain-containing protein [Vibrio tapetis subsp. quintayensis]